MLTIGPYQRVSVDSLTLTLTLNEESTLISYQEAVEYIREKYPLMNSPQQFAHYEIQNDLPVILFGGRISLTKFYFGSQGLGDERMTLIAMILQNMNIDHLDLSSNNITKYGLRNLLPILPRVNEINLSFNRLGKSLSLLNASESFKELNLAVCGIKEETFFDIYPLLLNAESVNLCGNEIGNAVLLLLQSKTIKYLDISGCNIDNSEALCKFLKKNKSLEKLVIAGNEVTVCEHSGIQVVTDFNKMLRI